MNIFKRWKEKVKKHFAIEEVLDLSYNYKYVTLEVPIQINNIFLVKDKDSLIFFVKKDDWKNRQVGHFAPQSRPNCLSYVSDWNFL